MYGDIVWKHYACSQRVRGQSVYVGTVCVGTVCVESVSVCGDSICGNSQCMWGQSVCVVTVCMWSQCARSWMGSVSMVRSVGHQRGALGRELGQRQAGPPCGEGGRCTLAWAAGRELGEARGAGRPLTSHLLLQAEDDGHGLVQDEQFGLRLLAAKVQLAHAAELLKGLIDVSNPQALAGIIGHPAFLLPLSLLLWGEKVVLILVCAMGEGSQGPEGDSEVTWWPAGPPGSTCTRDVCACVACDMCTCALRGGVWHLVRVRGAFRSFLSSSASATDAFSSSSFSSRLISLAPAVAAALPSPATNVDEGAAATRPPEEALARTQLHLWGK